MTAPLTKEQEQAIRTAAALLGGGEKAYAAALVIYHLGYMDGALDMAKAEHRAISTAMRSILAGEDAVGINVVPLRR